MHNCSVLRGQLAQESTVHQNIFCSINDQKHTNDTVCILYSKLQFVMSRIQTVTLILP